MTYEAWRITYQSSEQAARAAYATIARLTAELDAERAARDDFHETLYGAKLRLILDPDGDGEESNEVAACVGATFGEDNKLDILIQAGTYESPIRLAVITGDKP